MYAGRTTFRHGPGFVAFYAALTAFLAFGTWWMRRADGWSWVTLGLAGMTVVSAGAIVETLVLRIQLTHDALTVRDLRGSRSYRKADIARIEEAKGTPPALLLTGGSWVRLPAVGQNLGNSVRAWLRA